MGNATQSMYNSWFGSNLTHISNATGKDLVIGFKFTTIQLENINANAGLKNPIVDSSAQIQINFNRISWDFKFHLANRGFHQYRRRYTMEYMTIIDKSGIVLCENYPVEANRSFIITKDGIKPQKYGSSNFFEDTRGNIY